MKQSDRSRSGREGDQAETADSGPDEPLPTTVEEIMAALKGQRACAVIKYMYIYWLLLSNRNFKCPYLEAEVVEEVMGWLG